jgi:hypothetical protein
MDWTLAIARNRDALLRIVASLCAMARLAYRPAYLPRSLYFAVLRILRPAEAAVRRLISIAAHGLILVARKKRAAPLGLAQRVGANPVPSFCLIDPLKNFTPILDEAMLPPHLSALADPHSSPAHLEYQINAVHLLQRLQAISHALDTMSAQARRLARWQTLRQIALTLTPKPMRLSPFRPGRPPGYRDRIVHEVDTILRECHGLAWDRREAQNSS